LVFNFTAKVIQKYLPAKFFTEKMRYNVQILGILAILGHFWRQMQGFFANAPASGAITC